MKINSVLIKIQVKIEIWHLYITENDLMRVELQIFTCIQEIQIIILKFNITLHSSKID